MVVGRLVGLWFGGCGLGVGVCTLFVGFPAEDLPKLDQHVAVACVPVAAVADQSFAAERCEEAVQICSLL